MYLHYIDAVEVKVIKNHTLQVFVGEDYVLTALVGVSGAPVASPVRNCPLLPLKRGRDDIRVGWDTVQTKMICIGCQEWNTGTSSVLSAAESPC